MTLTHHQNKAAKESYDKYTGTHKVSFQEMKKLFVVEFSKVPYFECKPAQRVANDFYDFVEDYYFELRKQDVKAPIKYELKPQNELIELHFELNTQQNNEQICARCKRKFGTIQALNGHQRTCKPN